MSNDETRIERFRELWDALKNPKMLPEERDQLRRQLDAIARALEPEPTELEAFIDRLLHRQGSIEPDFEVIRRRNAELDRILLDDEPDDPRL